MPHSYCAASTRRNLFPMADAKSITVERRTFLSDSTAETVACRIPALSANSVCDKPRSCLAKRIISPMVLEGFNRLTMASFISSGLVENHSRPKVGNLCEARARCITFSRCAQLSVLNIIQTVGRSIIDACCSVIRRIESRLALPIFIGQRSPTIIDGKLYA